jgi:hypothetical protein
LRFSAGHTPQLLIEKYGGFLDKKYIQQVPIFRMFFARARPSSLIGGSILFCWSVWYAQVVSIVLTHGAVNIQY